MPNGRVSRAARNAPEYSQQDLFSLALASLDNSIHHPNILNYGEKDYPEQERFHRSLKRGRYLAGGNRGGKTDAEVVEAIWWATDTHPYQQRPASWGHGAIQIRFVVVDISKGVEQIILPKLKRWLPLSYLKDESWDRSWDAKNLILTLSNGTTIDFVTWGMDMMKLGGVPRHIIFFDEEPPQDIFNESMMRLVDYNGIWVIAATPSMGMGWTYDLLWEPSLDPENPKSQYIDTFTLSIEQNPYIEADAEEMDFYMAGMDKEEREVREHGTWVARSGLIFPHINQDSSRFVVPPFVPPRGWEWYSSVDFGRRHPTAWLWHAVGPQGQIITFSELYMSEWTVPMFAEFVHQREKAWGREPDLRVGDPAGKQRYGTTGTSYLMEYATRDINIQVDGIPHDVMIGLEKMQQYFELRVDSPWLSDADKEAGLQRPMWVISEACPNFIREMKKLKWATHGTINRSYDTDGPEEVHKKDDDAFDSARYFATIMPDLKPLPQGYVPELTDSGKVATTLSYGDMMAKLREDDSVRFADDTDPGWEVSYEYEDN